MFVRGLSCLFYLEVQRNTVLMPSFREAYMLMQHDINAYGIKHWVGHELIQTPIGNEQFGGGSALRFRVIF